MKDFRCGSACVPRQGAGGFRRWQSPRGRSPLMTFLGEMPAGRGRAGPVRIANEVRAPSARRRVALFTKASSRRTEGSHSIGPRSPIVSGPGVCHTRRGAGPDRARESRAALSLLAAPLAVPIDRELQATFSRCRQLAGGRLGGAVLRVAGLADSLRFLPLDGAVDRPLPAAKSSVDRHRYERRSPAARRWPETRPEHGARAGHRGGAQRGVMVEAAALLTPIGGSQTRLMTKRLPLTEDDSGSVDESYVVRPLFHRFSDSRRAARSPRRATSARDAAVVELLIANRRVFATRWFERRPPGDRIRGTRRDENSCALICITCADRTEWESPETDPAVVQHARTLRQDAASPAA